MADDTSEKKPELPRLSPEDISSAAKLVGGALFRTAGTVAKDAVGTATDISGRLASGGPVSAIVDEQFAQVSSVARALIGAEEASDDTGAQRIPEGLSLRQRGDALLYRSWNAADQARREHPAFERILGELTPDEARILRFLAVAGPQPSIDIRTHTPFGIGSQRLAAGISFIADMAGCAWPHRSRHYLGNLNRLGLVRFSTEPVQDFRRYYLLDAHPDAVAAMNRAKRTIAVYRSIYLSVFGEEFCEACFTTDGYNAGGWSHHDSGDIYWGKGPRLS